MPRWEFQKRKVVIFELDSFTTEYIQTDGVMGSK